MVKIIRANGIKKIVAKKKPKCYNSSEAQRCDFHTSLCFFFVIWQPGPRQCSIRGPGTKTVKPRRKEDEMKDVMKVSTVAFNAKWGDKEANLNRMTGYIEAAAAEGSNLIVFPEMGLTGYDDEEEKPLKEKMQYKLAETVPGPSSEKIAELAKKLGVYVAYGAVLGDPKHGINVEAPLDTIRQAAEEAVLNVFSRIGMSGGNMGGAPVNLTLQVALDGQVLGQKMVDWGKLQEMATGRNPYGLGIT